MRCSHCSPSLTIECIYCDSYNYFEALLTTGGDDRTIINTETGCNKYHIRPQPVAETDIFRGSCTGNPPTKRGYDAAKKLYTDAFANVEGGALDDATRKVFQDQRERLAKLLDLPKGAEIVLCPSGSDAEYIPLAIAKMLRPNAKITNGVTQVKEIGAGSAPAAVGRFFSKYTPLTGLVLDVDKSLSGFAGIEGKTLNARKADGSVEPASNEMSQFLKEAIERDEYPIIHGVYGGKTGLRDDVMPGSLDAGAKSLGIVDACQGRFTKEELQEWMDQDSVVLFTGSKFFQAPPFAGAVIIPPAIAKKLRNTKVVSDEMFTTDGLGGTYDMWVGNISFMHCVSRVTMTPTTAFLTDKELPECLDSWKQWLPKEDASNIGLALRWEAGLAGMEALDHVADEKRTTAYSEWADSVVRMVNEDEFLDAWWVERSIVSIRVANGKDKNWLNVDELRQLFRMMSMDLSAAVSSATPEERDALSKTAYIGQPVDVSESHGIVRIALGVDSMLSYLDDPESTLSEDKWAVKKLSAIGKHFQTLMESGV